MLGSTLPACHYIEVTSKTLQRSSDAKRHDKSRPIRTIHEKELNPPRTTASTTFAGFGIWGRRIANVQFRALGDGVLRRISSLECLTGYDPIDLYGYRQLVSVSRD
jgi:hypothetical protein